MFLLDTMEALEPSSMSVAAATIGEIQAGIERTRDNNPAKALEIESWLEDFPHRMVVLPMDAETCRIWARLMHGAPRQLSEDAMIAATAVRHGLAVATRNTRDFETFGIRLFNPFGPG
jgi:predicted nucleic acid-binding protein